MELGHTFKAVCTSLKRDSGDSKLIDAVDTLLGLTIICAPLALGPTALALLPLLRVKNELTKIGGRVFRAATKKQRDDYTTHLERMRTAHGLLVYTAFFDALDSTLPQALRERIDLRAEERRALASKAPEPESCNPASARPSKHSDTSPLTEVPIEFPHPTEPLQKQIEKHVERWKQLSDGFWSFVQMLAVWDEMEEDERKALRQTIDGVPEVAARRFESQYVALSQRFPDFAIWANLHEHEATQAELGKLASHVSEYVALSKHSQDSVDLGLVKLHEAIGELPAGVAKSDAAGILEGLTRHYAARLDDAIIEDRDSPSGDGPRLQFPKVREAFVPQPFRVIRPTGRSLHLEDEKTWSDLPCRDDLGPFLLSYLLSPYSTETPLLILGHPGSGKSLLTTVLAAQLAARHHSVVRVPLREVNADSGIVAQVEDVIGQVTKRRVDSWAKLSAAFNNHPPVVILDGYDELLQASGRVYAGYLREVSAFQKSEAEQGRPVRVIVTSRVTLIDKASVPSGSTVLRLLEFDARRQQEWIAVWNGANANYFQEAQIEEFRLPGKEEDGAEKILSLAEQPLLLLMLALYDSQGNQLRKSVALDRTRLYDELLRRFVTRERSKERAFVEDLTEQEQKSEIDKDMRRLGVAAVGMYNRRQVHILADQLGADLKFFDLTKQVSVTEGRPMSQADLLLGSFFFVHKSQAKGGSGDEGTAETEASAFEFLHNTLGEFLTADFILRWTIDEVQALAALRGQEALLSVFHEKLNSPDGLRRQWYASLVYTPLFTRPVVLEMMREWSGHLLQESGISRVDFAGHLDMVLHNQIERLISKRAMPSIMRKETVDERFRARFGDHPLIGHIAVYSVNLVLLRVIVCQQPFIMDEGAIRSYEDGARPWDRLVHVWRSWFSLEALNGLTAVLESVRRGKVVEVRAKSSFQVAEAQGRLEVLLNVSVAVADDLTAGVAGLAHSEVALSQVVGATDIEQRLGAERIDASFQIAIRQLQRAIRGNDGDRGELARTACAAMEIAAEDLARDEVERVALLFAAGVRSAVAGTVRRPPYEDFAGSHLRRMAGPAANPRLIAYILEKSPEAALTWVKAIKLAVGARAFRDPDREELVDRVVHGGPPLWERFRDSPTSVVAYVELLRELGLPIRWRRSPREFFESLFHPRMVIDLVERSPEAALALFGAVEQLMGESTQFWRHVQPQVVERLLDLGYLFELAERSPEAATSLARLVRQRGEGRVLRDLDPELSRRFVHDVKRAVETRYFLDLVEYSPEAALEVLRVIRTLGEREPIATRLHPELLERLSDPRFVLRLFEGSPEAAVAMIQIACELGGASGQFWRRVEPDAMRRLLDPRYLLQLAERSPEAAVSLARLLRQWGDGRMLRDLDPELSRRFIHDLVKRVLETPYFLDLVEYSPEAALEVLRVIRTLGEREPIATRLHPELLERLADARFVLRLSERSPEAAVAMIQIARELGGASGQFWRRVEPDAMRRLLDPRYLLQLAEQNPEGALLLVQVGEYLGLDDRRGSQQLDHVWHPEYVESVVNDWLSQPVHDPRGFAVALRLARHLGSPNVIRALAEAVSEAVRFASLPYLLPLAVLDDLHWLAGHPDAAEWRDALRAAFPRSPAAKSDDPERGPARTRHE